MELLGSEITVTHFIYVLSLKFFFIYEFWVVLEAIFKTDFWGYYWHVFGLRLIENVWSNLSRNVLDHLLYDFLGDFLEHFWTMFWKSFGCFGLQVVEKETIHLNKGQKRIFLFTLFPQKIYAKGGFFQKVWFVFQISKSPKKIFQKTILSLKLCYGREF